MANRKQSKPPKIKTIKKSGRKRENFDVRNEIRILRNFSWEHIDATHMRITITSTTTTTYLLPSYERYAWACCSPWFGKMMTAATAVSAALGSPIFISDFDIFQMFIFFWLLELCSVWNSLIRFTQMYTFYFTGLQVNEFISLNSHIFRFMLLLLLFFSVHLWNVNLIIKMKKHWYQIKYRVLIKNSQWNWIKNMAFSI